MKVRSVVLFFFLSALSALATSAAAAETAEQPIPPAHLMQPAELAALLHAGGERPLVLQVGSRVLFAQAHIPDSEYVGAAGQDAGLQALEARVQKLDRAQPIVIYCGCCPWPKCPNIRRAYAKLDGMGFTHVRVLYIADNFGADWVDKGFPVARDEQ